jgi:uncharacterized membrane protein
MAGEAPEERPGATLWFNLDRLVAFSDGVFAIALTLLVLTFDAPGYTSAQAEGQLWSYVKDQFPELFGFTLSFFIVARYWMAHHRLFHIIRECTPRLVQLNFVLLFFVVLLPYPTELYGDYPQVETAIVLYAASVGIAGLASAALTYYAVHDHRLIDPAVTDDHIAHSTLRGLTLPVVFLLSIPVALIDPSAGPFVWLLLIPARFYLTRRYGRIHDPF